MNGRLHGNAVYVENIADIFIINGTDRRIYRSTLCILHFEKPVDLILYFIKHIGNPVSALRYSHIVPHIIGVKFIGQQQCIYRLTSSCHIPAPDLIHMPSARHIALNHRLILHLCLSGMACIVRRLPGKLSGKRQTASVKIILFKHFG